MTREETESRMGEVWASIATAYQIIDAASKAQDDLVLLRQELVKLCEAYAENHALDRQIEFILLGTKEKQFSEG